MFRPAHLSLFILCMLLFVAACGREAPPRAVKPTTAPPTPFPTQQSAQAAQAGPERRALGDPNAPITVIEYGDYQ